MSIMEGISQYQNNTAANTQAMQAVKETIRPSSSHVQELAKGQIFEGTVLEIKNGKVTIGLSNGESIVARMEAGVSLEKGMPMLFEVKNINGEQIAIRPMNWENMQNPTLLKALEAAGLKVTQQNLSMVSEMMKEQMPVDKASLLQMVRVAASFPESDIQTLIQMQKTGIEISKNTIHQFENYRNDQQSFLPEIKDLLEHIPRIPELIYGRGDGGVSVHGQSNANFNTGSLLGFQQSLADILLGGRIVAFESPQAASAVQPEAAIRQIVQEKIVQSIPEVRVDKTEGTMIQQNLFSEEEIIGQQKMNEHPLANGVSERTGEAAHNRNLSTILTHEQQNNLANLLKECSGAIGNEVLFRNGQLNSELTAGELLQQIVAAVGNSDNLTNAFVKKLFCSDEYKTILKRVMEEQWLIAPEKMKEDGAVKELYLRLGKQMEQLQQMLNQIGTQQGSELAKSAQGVQSNIEFMNQLNQLYTYVQIPLKLKNQNAHSDLYVYTNKKSLQEKDGELTALLHLDMEHLGATDIYIKLKGSSMDTTFYLEDIGSYEVIENHIDILYKKLEEKGYQCKISVENRGNHQDFVEEFLEKEKPVGKFMRYSFDVKA